MKWISLSFILMFSGCTGIKQAPFKQLLSEDFDSNLSMWTIENHTFANNLAYFDTANVKLQNGILQLSLANKRKGGKAYTGAEVRSKAYFLYGKFEARLKATNNLGCISAFFLYRPGSGNYNEIDVEISGKYPHVATLNHWINERSHGQDLDLPFNASADFHDYVINWQPKKIAWFVDRKLIYETTTAVPKKPMQVVFNLWATKSASWAGEINDASLPANSFVEAFKYTPN